MNTVIRVCNKCRHEGEEDHEFSYVGNCVWRCHKCGSMYTHISEIIDPEASND